MKPKKPTTQRIAEHLVGAHPAKHTYYLTMLAVFPPNEYPDAWRYSSNGGPPGCAMTFGAALRKMKVVNYRGDLSFDSTFVKTFLTARTSTCGARRST
jgi:hypothetical protein